MYSFIYVSIYMLLLQSCKHNKHVVRAFAQSFTYSLLCLPFVLYQVQLTDTIAFLPQAFCSETNIRAEQDIK